MTEAIFTAKHEVGHALVQSILGIGPQHVEVRNENDLWAGQSLPFPHANEDNHFVKLLVSQMAGPIAQVCSAPESIAERLGVVTDNLIDVLLRFDNPTQNEVLNDLGWFGDLRGINESSPVLRLAGTTKNARKVPCFYETGAFVFAAEEVLFDIFRDIKVSSEVSCIARKLTVVGKFDGAHFQQLAFDVLKLEAWQPLRMLDLDFLPPFKRK